MPNPVKDAWRAGRAVVNGWLSIPSAFSAEMMAKGGFDSLTVDMQHGVQDYLSVVACFQAIQAHPVVPFVRVPWNEPGIIGKVLDAGAMGLICPMVNTAEEARALVAACRYPPLGARSFGPIRAAIYGQGGGYFATANEDIAVIPMIETRQALDNLEAILDVPGIDGAYIGPSDLGLSLGFEPRLDRQEPEILAIYDRLLAETRKRGLIAGIHNGTPEYARTMVDRGFRLVTCSNDAALVATGAIRDVAVMRGK
ncbi:HpcH/HpaI aldolase family protein [Roseomonas marmotae]|uniref:2,4-dihydroxyhept-2-ene-1,7-dioic acid aldolase n=1 Tax=Roseomonas marmotae TaxID=2768161 RepID=A0ABS3KJ62_9PROT|nr:aldolase/citrate lyase family protein [Roseomonas marmotae]MBO1076653.1 2,4-dihydroxyhept-2-ene-1,7-dioic acid aldolase [Roseomonas marmotae]QTI79610.1 2,4-dihydroxyhept-2-ene-1,7-dioic acid aldolase [Roseomonas marmotae]